MKNEVRNDSITLTGENGKSVECEIAAEIAYGDYNYLILRPLTAFAGMSADEAMVFRVETTPEGYDTYVLEEDDEIIDAIGEIYNSSED